MAFCNVDQPLIGNSIKPGEHATARLGYFRLHGRNYANWFKEDAGRDARYDYLYTKEEIRQLSEQIRKVQQSTEETYAITNNHFRGQALVNAMEILEELDADAAGGPAAAGRSLSRPLREIDNELPPRGTVAAQFGSRGDAGGAETRSIKPRVSA